MKLLSRLFKKETQVVRVNQISRAGVEFIKSWESLDLESYQDIAGVWTIGYGHTMGVVPNQKITKLKAYDLLANDIAFFEGGVERLVKVDLNQNQFDALVSFAFNVGLTAFAKSTLLRCVNAKMFEQAYKEFFRWRFAGGKESSGLLNRRKAEAELFSATGSDYNASRA